MQCIDSYVHNILCIEYLSMNIYDNVYRAVRYLTILLLHNYLRLLHFYILY